MGGDNSCLGANKVRDGELGVILNKVLGEGPTEKGHLE